MSPPASRLKQESITLRNRFRGAARTGRRATAGAVLGVLLLAGAAAQAQSVLPNGGQVRAGSVTIGTPTGNNLSINQSSNRAVVDWKSFSVGQPNAVNITQPGSQAALLNRVTGNTPSTIAGQLNANGQVYLVNPNGIAITKSGTVRADGGFVASTLGISNRNFMRGNLDFTGNGASAPVTNQGSISTGSGGYTALLGGSVNNSGTINVPLGKVGLGSGERATLDLNGDGFMQVTAPTGAKTAQGEALVTNSGVINAPGGTVELKAATVATAIRDAVNMSGVVSANSVSGHNGAVTLGGGPGGNVNVTGTVDVSGVRAGQTGGTAVVSGRSVNLGKTARIDARGNARGGTVKIGGGSAGRDPLVQNALTANISGGAVIDASAIDKGNGGNVAIWSDTGTTVAGTIRAEGGRNGGDGGFIETSGGTLNITSTAFVSAAAYQGAAGRWLLDPVDLIIDQSTATAIGTALGGGSDVTLATSANSYTANPASVTPGVDRKGAGDIYVEAPIAWTNTTSALSLSAYNDIYIDAPITFSGNSRLFLSSNNANVVPAANIYVASAITNNGTGSLNFITNQNSLGPVFVMGQGNAQFPNKTGTLNINAVNYTLLYDMGVSATGIQSINSNPAGNYALGLPIVSSGSMSLPVTSFSGRFNGLGNSISNLAIADNSQPAIGVFGANSGTIANFGLIGGSLTSSLAGVEAGALAGRNSGTIVNSFAGMNVSAAASSASGSAGGLVGTNSGSISGSYATGAVGAARSTGGLAGVNNGRIADSYAIGQVTAGAGGLAAGGLVGYQSGGSLSNVYATGNLASCSTNCGGLLGLNDNGGSIGNGYWNTTTSGTTVGIGSGGGSATGLTTAQLTAGLPPGFSPTVWDNLNNQTSPYLLNNPGPVYVGSDAFVSTPVFTSAQLQAIGSNLTGNYVLGDDIDLTGAAFTAIADGNNNGYRGTFNGLGHVVYNLTINTPGNDNVGLFSTLGAGGTVANVGVAGASVTGRVRVGALVGQNFGTVKNGFATGSVTGSGGSAGGLVGRNQSTGSISQSFADVTVSNNSVALRTGGLVGYNSGGSIDNSYATGNVTAGSGSVGGLVGQNDGTVTASYSTGSVTGGVNKGGSIGQNTASGVLTNVYWDTTTSGTPTGIGSNDNVQTVTGLTTSGLEAALPGGFSSATWGNLNNRTTPYLLRNSGPVYIGEDPFKSTIVTTPAQLQAIANNLSGNYALGKNIDLAGVDFNVIGTDTAAYKGTFNGLGYVVENLTITDGEHVSVGLFSILDSGGTIKNVGIIGGSVSGTRDAGALAGTNNGGTISNTYSTASVIGGDNVGGLVGTSSGGTITNSYSTGSVAGTGFVGGLVGNNGGFVQNSYATGAVSNSGISGAAVGGLVGQNLGSISVAYSAGHVSGGAGVDVGGFVGTNSANIDSALFNADRAGVSAGVGSGNGNDKVTPLTGGEVFQTDSYKSHGFVFVQSTNSALGNAWVRVGPLTGINESASLDGTMPMLASEYSTLIQNAHQLQLIALDFSANYTMGRNIDASGTGSSSSAATGTDIWSKQAFIPLGNFASIGPQYTGTFDGGGFAISNLTIRPVATLDDPNNGQYVGLFGVIGAGGTVKNVGLLGGSVGGNVGGNGSQIGPLAGRNDGSILNAYSTMAVNGFVGPVAGSTFVGGLVGGNSPGASIVSAYATGAVTGSGTLDGLVGTNSGTVTNGYYDAGTTGRPLGATAGGAIGETTAALQADLPSGFDPSIWTIIQGKTYPYFLTQFGGASPQVITGTVYTGAGTGPAGSGYSVTAAVDGTILTGGVQTGANGYYYYLLPPSSILTGDDALAFVNGTVNGVSMAGAAFLNQTTNTTAFTADIYGNSTLRIVTPATSYAAAQGDLTANVNAAGVSSLIGGLVNLNITATGSSFAIDQQLNASGTLTIAASGNVAQTADGVVSAGTLTGSSAGGLALTQTANAIGIFGSWSDTGKGSGGISLTTSQGLQIAGTVSSPGPVTLNSGGDLAVNAGISSVGTVDLESGGAITQTAGISAATLTGSAGNGVSLGTVANAVGVFGPFRNTGSGSLTFKGSSDGILTIAGAISNPGRPVSLESAGGSLMLASGSDIVSNAVTLRSGGAIAQNSLSVIDPTSLLIVAGGDVTLTGDNVVDSLAATLSAGNFSFNNKATTLTVDTVGGQAGITTAGGSVTLTTTTSGDIVLNQAITTGAGAVVLAAVDAFKNNVGTAAIVSTTPWLIYSNNPGSDVFGGLDSGNTAIWNATLSSRPPGSVSKTGTGQYLFAFSPTLTLHSTSLSKIYGVDFSGSIGGAVSVTGLQPAVAGAFLGDSAASVYAGSPVATSLGAAATAGVAGSAYTITVNAGSFAVLSGSGYNSVPILDSSGTLTVTPAKLTITANDVGKGYGATTSFAGTEFGTSGLLNADTVTSVTLTSAGAVAGANVSTYAITPSSAVGTGLDNYAITYVNGSLNVSPATLVVSGNKTYDGNGSFPLGSLSVSGGQNGETVSLTSGSGQASSGNANSYPGSPLSGLNISVSGGNQLAGNYTLPQTGTLTILTAKIAVSGTKTYDGTAGFGTAMLAASGAQNGETIAFTAGSGTASSPNAGTSSGAVSGIVFTVSGGNGLAANYSLTDSGSFTINPAPLTAAGAKSYDGGAAFASGALSVAGAVNGETLSVTAGSGVTSSPNAGTYAGSGLSGLVIGVSGGQGLAANYALPATATLTISPAPLTISASKAYDGSGVFGRDLLTIGGAQNGETLALTAGTGKASSGNAGTYAGSPLSGLILGVTGGNGLAGNYALPATGSLTITPASLTVSGTKVYDGGAGFATALLSPAGAKNGEILTLTSGSGTAASGNAGTYAGSTLSGLVLNVAGGNALPGNYTLPATGTLTITPAPLTVSGSKSYDGGAFFATGTLTAAGAVNGEALTLTVGSGTAASANAGAYAASPLSGLTLGVTGGNALAGNYTLPATGTLTIVPAPLTVTGSKSYDGSAVFATGSLAVAGAQNGESLSLSAGAGTASSANAGSYAGTALSGLTLSVTGGNGLAGNYSLPATGSLTITPASLTVSGTKVYDGAAGFATALLSPAGAKNGEILTLTSGSGTAASGNAGSYAGSTLSGLVLNVAGGNALPGNYTLPATGTLTITPAALTVTGSKVYDGASAFGVGALAVAGAQNGDVLTLTAGAGTAPSANAGTYAGSALGGLVLAVNGGSALSGNYTLPSTGTLSITPAPLTVSGSRAYDGTAAFATAALTVSGAKNGETLTLIAGTGTASSANAGTYAGSPLSGLAIGVSGGNALVSNYSLPGTGTLTVTPAPVSVSGSKVYDGGGSFGTALLSLAGAKNGETLTLTSGSGSTSAANTGTYAGAPVSGLVLSVSGGNALAGNYALPATGTLTITAAPLTVSGSKSYDGGTVFATGTLTAAGAVNGETLTLTAGSGTAASANAGAYAASPLSGPTLAVTGGNALASNYTLPASGTLTIVPASLAVTGSKSYDGLAVFATGSLAVAGAQNGESLSLSAGAGTASSANAGSYAGTALSGLALSVSGGNGLASNYTLPPAGTLTIVPATLTVTGKKIYDASSAFGVGALSVSGGASGETLTLTAGTGTAASANVGSYPGSALSGLALSVTGGGALASNYALPAAGTLTITPATLTYTAAPTSRTYGASNPVLTGTVSGFAGADMQASATTGVLAFASPATASTSVGSYAITGSGLSATNYTFVQAAANATALTITPATLTYTAKPNAKIYGSANPTLVGSVLGFVNGDDQSSATTGTLTFTSPATTGSGVGNYAVIGSGLSAANYTFVQAAANATALTVTPATLTYAAIPVSRVYGAANPGFTGTVTGFVNGENQAMATTGALSFGSTATAASGVGSYAVTGSGLTAANYTFVQAPSNGTALSITPATLTYTATLVSRIYGAANPVFGGSVTGFVNSDTASTAATGTLAFTSPATSGSGVGTYAITGSGLSATNYLFAQAPANATALTVSPATLTYTATPMSRIYGSANPALTGTVSGFVNGETQQTATAGALTFTSPATTGSGVGNYAITGSGLSAANYVFVQAAANAAALTVAPATLIYTATPVSRVYGDANPALTGTVTGFANGETQATATTGALSFTSPATVTSGIGSYAITGSGLTASNYVFVQAPGNASALSVTPAPLSVTALDQSKVYGQTVTVGVPGAFGVSGLRNGDSVTGVTLTGAGGAAAATVLGGPYTITPSAATGIGIGNYIVSYTTGKLTVTPALLTITASDQVKTYGQVLPLGTTAFTAAGLVNSDAVTGVTLSSPGSVSSAGVAGSPYAITPGAAVGSGLTNYTVSYVNGKLTVNPATVTVTLQGPIGKTFDGSTTADLSSANFAVTGVVAGDNVAVNTPSTGTYSATTQTPDLSVTASGLSLGGAAAQNYVLASPTVTSLAPSGSGSGGAGGSGPTVTITPAPIVVAAADASRTAGQPNPPLTFSITSGRLFNNDVLTGLLTTSADANSLPGTYAITRGSLSAPAGYQLTVIDGVLTVQPGASGLIPSLTIQAALPSVATLASIATGSGEGGLGNSIGGSGDPGQVAVPGEKKANSPQDVALASIASFRAASCSVARDAPALFVVLPSATGKKIGGVVVSDGANEEVLDQSFAAAETSGGALSACRVSKSDIDTTFRKAVAARPVLPHHFTLHVPAGGGGLDPDSQTQYREILADIAQRKAYEIEVIGYAQGENGSSETRQRALARAGIVRGLLARDLIDTSKIKLTGRTRLDVLLPAGDKQPPRQADQVIEVWVR